MKTVKLNLSKKNESVLIHLIWSLLFITFLFFIDEGYYNFNWATKFWNWVIFAVYVTGILFGQCITHVLILRKYTGKHKTLLTCLIGIPLGTILLFALFMSQKP